MADPAAIKDQAILLLRHCYDVPEAILRVVYTPDVQGLADYSGGGQRHADRPVRSRRGGPRQRLRRTVVLDADRQALAVNRSARWRGNGGRGREGRDIVLVGRAGRGRDRAAAGGGSRQRLVGTIDSDDTGRGC